MKIPENFIRLAKHNTIKNISLGYDDIYLFEIENILKEQIGYSIDNNGNSLVTDESGSWQPNWLAIGYHENTGDPFFIDTSSKKLPVYTSMHGAGSWDPTMISDTYTNFLEILDHLQQISRGRENPVLLESNPILDEEIENFISAIEAKNIKSEVWFWENLLEQ